MLIKLLIYFIIGVIIYRFAKSWLSGSAGSGRKVKNHKPVAVDDVMIQDPVCGAYFPERNGVTLNNGGKIHHFCSERCRDKYQDRSSGDR